MLGDIIGEIVGDMIAKKANFPHGQFVGRVLFGLVGTLLCVAGMLKTAGYDAGLPFRLAGMFLFFSIASFCFFNVILLREWKWPGRLCLVSLPALFLVRFIFGA